MLNTAHGIGRVAAAALVVALCAPAPADASEADAARYCEAIRDPAREARVAWQAQSLLDIEARVEARIAELAALRAEYETWLARREDFLRKAEETVISIYARMRPDAAAAQLAAMDNETAGAVIAKLNPRQSSAILNEMEPGRAALLTRGIAGTAFSQDNAARELPSTENAL
ncbi:MAG: MotE family protein [Microvirga sp.]|nr:MotE family protein [Microvirga sp.]